MKKLSSALFIMSFCLLSCTNTINKDNFTELSNISSVKKEINYYPLKKDMSWTYKLQQFQDGQSNNKFKEMTMFVAEEKNDPDSKQFVLRRSYPNSTTQPNPSLAKVFPDRLELSRYVQQEIFSQYNTPTKTKDYIISLKFPINVGDSWGGRDFAGGKEKISVQGFETITVPAGTFDCVKINHNLKYDNGKEDNLYYWYGANVGMVKLHEEITVSIGGPFMKMSSDGELINKSF
ncbi:MAG: hypothetical protein AABZ74_07725 [Cyanobacteriota bacterium]